jgi:hypothetical protein
MKLKTISLFIACLLFSFSASAQTERRHIYNFGIDPITQGLYLGFDHAIRNYSVGLDVGTSFGLLMPLNVTVCLDNAFYFGNPNKYNLRTWHVNARFAYSKILVENKPSILYIVPSIGKTFSLNKMFGLSIDLGYGFEVLGDWGEPMVGSGSTYYFGDVSFPTMRIELKFY